MALRATVATKPDTARDRRYAAQRVQWRESSLDRVRACGHHAVTDAGVGVRVSTDSAGKRSAGFSGLATCGSVHACAVCNHKIASERAEEIAEAIRRWEASSSTRYVCMNTFTMRHNIGQGLASLLAAESYAFSKMTSGRGWADDQLVYGSVELVEGRGARIPWVRVGEITFGYSNGWHAHIHMLLFLDRAHGDNPTRLGHSMFERWRSALVRKGLDAPIRGRGGLDVKPFARGASDVSRYVTKSTFDHADKAAWEIAGGANKDAKRGNRTPFGLLRSVVDSGDADDLDRWHEYEQATQGRRQIGWARGFRQWLALEAERTDEEIAETELDGETVAWIEADEWTRLRDHKAELLAAAEFLPLEFLRSAPALIWLNEYRSRINLG